MILPDVNVLVYACFGQDERALAHAQWLEEHLAGDENVALLDVVLTGVIRITTHRRAWLQPAPVDEALRFVAALRAAPATVDITPTARTWDVFERLCIEGRAHGNLVPDAWIAANAIATGATLVTTDRGFGRFPGLKYTDPLA